jgi:hypothetical protein
MKNTRLADASMRMRTFDAGTEANAEKPDVQCKPESEKSDTFSGETKDNSVDQDKVLLSK